MTVKRWEELNDYLLSISVGGEEIGEGNGCYRVDDGAYVTEEAYKEAFEDDHEQEAWATVCNLQTVEWLSLQDAIKKVSELTEEELDGLNDRLVMDEDACVYYTEGWDD